MSLPTPTPLPPYSVLVQKPLRKLLSCSVVCDSSSDVCLSPTTALRDDPFHFHHGCQTASPGSVQADLLSSVSSISTVLSNMSHLLRAPVLHSRVTNQPVCAGQRGQNVGLSMLNRDNLEKTVIIDHLNGEEALQRRTAARTEED